MVNQSANEQPVSRRLDRALKGTHWQDTISDPRKILELLESNDLKSFTNVLTALNAIVVESLERGGFAPINKSVGALQMTAYISPAVEDREDLFRSTHAALIQLLKQGRRRDAGLLLYTTIQSIHPFTDGNGRTGRVLYYLLSADPALTKLPLSTFIDEVTSNRHKRAGRQAFNEHLTNMGDAQKVLDQLVADDTLGREFREEYGAISLESPPGMFSEYTIPERGGLQQLSRETRAKLLRVLKENRGGPFNAREVAVAAHLQSRHLLDRYQSNDWRVQARHAAITSQDRVKLQYSISPDLFDDLTEEDANKIVRIFFALKKRMIQKLTDVIVNPKKYPDANMPGKFILNSFYSPKKSPNGRK